MARFGSPHSISQAATSWFAAWDFRPRFQFPDCIAVLHGCLIVLSCSTLHLIMDNIISSVHRLCEALHSIICQSHSFCLSFGFLSCFSLAQPLIFASPCLCCLISWVVVCVMTISLSFVMDFFISPLNIRCGLSVHISGLICPWLYHYPALFLLWQQSLTCIVQPLLITCCTIVNSEMFRLINQIIQLALIQYLAYFIAYFSSEFLMFYKCITGTSIIKIPKHCV